MSAVQGPAAAIATDWPGPLRELEDLFEDLPFDAARLGVIAAAAALVLGWVVGRRSVGLGWFVAFAAALLVGEDFVDSRTPDQLGGTLAVVTVLAVVAIAAVTPYGERDAVTRRRGAVLWAAAAVGVFVCVPDTEAVALVGAGASLLAAVAWTVRTSKVSVVGLGGTGVLLTVTAAVGSVGRPPAMAGAIAAMWLPVAGPALETALRRGRGVAARLDLLPAAAVQSVVAVAAGRLAGVGRETTAAVGIAVVVAGAGLAAWAVALTVPALRAEPGRHRANRRS